MNLSEIEARLANATPGPWLLPESARSGRQMVFVTGEFGTYNICDSAGEMDTANAELVAHAPTDLPNLIAEVKRLKNVLEAATRLAHMDAQLIVAAIQAEIKAEQELAKFYKCADGQCLDWASGVYHSDKVWHKEDE